ncbi:YrbL family protein [Ruegeria halocynthiae]|uniref:YrbL family protein n=1 Tax=Ruegeria halocynthiae TaxID=985054 RepID=UPI0005600FFB|nr:YrbL family protein [Ruegeria halocynthiae]
MLFAAQLLQLSGQDPVASGGHRDVYACPGQSHLLIKVTRPRKRPNRSYTKRLIRRLLPDSVYRNAIKEIECEMKAALKSGTEIARMPLARCFGIVQTDIGPGIVVERIASDDGGLADHLSTLCKQGPLGADLLAALNSFAKNLFRLQIVARDIHESNIVYGLRNQARMFILIDGYGERNLVPLRTLSRSLNDRSLNKQMDGIAERVGLIWDAQNREFRAA